MLGVSCIYVSVFAVGEEGGGKRQQILNWEKETRGQKKEIYSSNILCSSRVLSSCVLVCRRVSDADFATGVLFFFLLKILSKPLVLI